MMSSPARHTRVILRTCGRAACRAVTRSLLLATVLPVGLAAQAFTVTPLAEPRPQDPTYQLPLVPTRTVRFTTDEGTNMSVDVSPDGTTILFDLLGDLYTVPITGGTATRIMGGTALDLRPRYSPDGRQIVFVSDRSGQENFWLADADGRHPHPLARMALDTSTSDKYTGDPVWTPDGRFVMAQDRMYDEIRGTVMQGVAYDVTTGAVSQRPELAGVGPAFGGSPREVYVWQNPWDGSPAVNVYDFITGRARRLVAARNVSRLAVSRDNRWLVYSTVVDQQTSLRLRDLRTGDERWLVHAGSGAAEEDRARLGAWSTSFAFTPDGQAIVVTAGGKLWRIAVPSGQWTPIPFQAEVELDLGPLSQFQYPVPDSFTVRQIREPRFSPDGQRLAFIALDKLYLMDFPHGTPRRATTAVGVVENYPAWSPDGRSVAFSTYSDLEGGHIYSVDAARVLKSAPPAPERLTRDADLYTRLVYSPDGRRLVFGRTPWRELQQHVERTPTLTVDLGWIPAEGGAATRITRLPDFWAERDAGAPPQFLPSAPDRLVVPLADALVSMRWDGSDRRTLLRWPASGFGSRDWTSMPAQVMVSPEGAHALVTYRSNLYLATLLPGRRDSLLIDVSITPPAVPLRRISRSGAEFVGWAPGGQQFYYALGHSLFVYDLPAGAGPVRDSLRSAWHDVTVRVARDRARGTIALRGARLITMKGDEVLARGDLVVRDGRIVSIGSSGTVVIPQGAQVIDVAGKTIVPGYVDLHTHMLGPYNTHKTQLSQYLAHLAYGVTTTRNPQTFTSDFLAYADRVEAGDLLGPRVLGTGPAVGQWRKEPLTSLTEVRDLLRRYSAEFYQTQTLKQYMAGNRKVRQWIVMASHELRLSPTTEGGGEFKRLLADMVDGYAGHEHGGHTNPLYRDFVLLAAASGITYDPTLMVAHGGNTGLNRMKAEAHPLDDPKLRRFSPHEDLVNLSQSTWSAEGAYVYPEVAASAGKIVAAGGHVGIGAHGELHGLGTHWELWLLSDGGLPNLEVLRAGTLTGARAVGLDRDLGSLEPGKLADLQVLDGNPLEDLRQTTTIRYVMKNGRLYDAATLDERWPRQRQLGPQWWQLAEPPDEMVRASNTSR